MMINIIKALEKNKKEAIKILKASENNTITFAEWDDDEDCYSNADDCPYIRYSNDDGEISTLLVVAARYNDEKKKIEIITSDGEYEKTDNNWFPLDWADDISFWQVLDAIGDSID